MLLKNHNSMNNHSSENKNRENLKSLQRIFISNRVPVSGSINLTNRCNLNCIHCYLGDRNSKLRRPDKELSTSQWLSIIDEITHAGCLNLLLSGGEVMVRDDFEAIYRKAATNGMLVTVFTNGTMFNEKTLSLFEELPPRAIEITLYGATQQTYEKVTRVKGSFRQCLKSIRNLTEKKIRLKLKTMILVQNSHELQDMKEIASGFGVDFRMDPAVSACLDGEKAPIACRVNPAEAVQLDFADPLKTKRWVDYHKKNKNRYSTTEYLFNCGAGLTNFHIDPSGKLLPCMMLNKPAFDLKKGNFIDGWENAIFKIRQIKAASTFKCKDCDKRELCSGCPALFELENGSLETPSEYLCDIAERRREAITANLQIEESLI